MADCIGHILVGLLRCRDRGQFEELLGQYRFLAEELVIASDGRWAFTEHQPMRSAFRQRRAAKHGA